MCCYSFISFFTPIKVFTHDSTTMAGRTKTLQLAGLSIMGPGGLCCFYPTICFACRPNPPVLIHPSGEGLLFLPGLKSQQLCLLCCCFTNVISSHYFEDVLYAKIQFLNWEIPKSIYCCQCCIQNFTLTLTYAPSSLDWPYFGLQWGNRHLQISVFYVNNHQTTQ